MLDDLDPSVTLLPSGMFLSIVLFFSTIVVRPLTGLLGLGRQRTGKIWYNAAIFCLERGNFMRAPNARSVQAIAILCMCFHAWGDAELADHMRSCAIRIAHRLWLTQSSSSSVGAPYLSQEGQCRLWWTLIICNWYCLRASCIHIITE